MVGQNCWMTKSQQNYPTDLNDTQWLKIRPYLPATAQTGRPREHSWRMILNSIFYILQSGCAWRMLPKEMPPWKTVYHYFRLWRNDGTWERINRLLREKYAYNLEKSVKRVPVFWTVSLSRPPKEVQNAVLMLERKSADEKDILWWILWA